MTNSIAHSRLLLTPMPPTHFGLGAVDSAAVAVRGTGSYTAVVVTDPGLAGTAVMTRVTDVLAAGGITVTVFSEVHANPTTGDVAAGAAAVAARGAGDGRPALVAVGGGSPIDAAKGIAVAAVNPERGRDLDYRRTFAQPALPLVAVPTTAGTGTETNAFGVITDPAAERKFYVGGATSLPAAAILDPELTVGLPPAATAATGMDALVHALESVMSSRANPWSEGLARQAIRMIAAYLPRAVADGTDLEARSQMLLASHLAGAAFASTGLGICHAIGHSLGGRFGIAHGVALTLVLPQVLRFNAPVCEERLAEVAFAFGAGDTGKSAAWNAGAAIDAITGLAAAVGLTGRLGEFGITAADFSQISADTLDDEVLVNTPRMPTAADITAMLLAALRLTRCLTVHGINVAVTVAQPERSVPYTSDDYAVIMCHVGGQVTQGQYVEGAGLSRISACMFKVLGTGEMIVDVTAAAVVANGTLGTVSVLVVRSSGWAKKISLPRSPGRPSPARHPPRRPVVAPRRPPGQVPRLPFGGHATTPAGHRPGGAKPPLPAFPAAAEDDDERWRAISPPP